jgi:hypothetical protein
MRDPSCGTRVREPGSRLTHPRAHCLFQLRKVSHALSLQDTSLGCPRPRMHLPTRQMVTLDGPHPYSDCPDAPSKLVAAGATSGPHPGHERPDRSGQQRSQPGRHLPRSQAGPEQVPQVASTARGSLTRKRPCASTSRSRWLPQANDPQPAQPRASAPPRHAPWPRTPGPAWHAPWPGQPATRPGQRWPRALARHRVRPGQPPRPARRPAPGGSDCARGPARRASAAQTCLAQDRPW